jgi:NAD(P)H-dependent nitrite reductase small subunit
MWHPVARLDDIPLEEGVSCKVDGRRVAVFHLKDGVFATNDRCTHGGASLADGFVKGDCVECPLHEGVFHIPTGKAVSGVVSVNVRIYPVRVEDGVVSVDVD